jgi:prolyl-tRNA synthetase
MFADMELIGIPHRITIGDRGLKDGNVEYQARGETTGVDQKTAPVAVAVAEIGAFIRRKLSA